MKYLKFLTNYTIKTPEDWEQRVFKFIYGDSKNVLDENILNTKSLEVRLANREVASIINPPKNYNLEQAFFEIAKNYVSRKIKYNESINDEEKLYPNALNYLVRDSESLEDFQTGIIEIQE